MSRFRVQARTLFLTYPQSGSAKKEDLLLFLVENFQPEYCVVSSETHADGSPHLHAVAGFAARREWSGVGAFDFAGLHPNVQSARNAAAVIQYTIKGGCYDTFGAVPIRQRWADIAAIGERDEFLSAVRAAYPRDFILSNSRLVEYGEQLATSARGAYEPDLSRSWDLPTALVEWLPNLQVSLSTMYSRMLRSAMYGRTSSNTMLRSRMFACAKHSLARGEIL